MSLSLWLTWSLTLVISVVSSTPDAPAPVKSAPCFIAGFEPAALCLSISVPRDWAHPDEGQITVAAAILPALGRGNTRDPLVVLPGGPGQAGTDLPVPKGSKTMKARPSRMQTKFCFDQRPR